MPQDSSGADPLAQRRDALFDRLLGAALEVVPDPSPAAPRIDVRIHGPGHGGRAFYTLVTSGSSDRALALPAGVEGAHARIELALYCDQPGPGLVRLLRTIARLPHDRGLWLGHGHSLPNGDPPAALFPGSALDTLLVLDDVVAPERDLRELLAVGGEPVNLLFLLPITSAECALKVEKGTEALLEVFNREQVSFVIDPGRVSLV